MSQPGTPVRGDMRWHAEDGDGFLTGVSDTQRKRREGLIKSWCKSSQRHPKALGNRSKDIRLGLLFGHDEKLKG